MKEIPTVGAALSGSLLEDVAAVQRIAAVPSILDVICQVTGLRLAAISRVTDAQWVCCAINDQIGYGVEPGTELELNTTLCDELRGHKSPIIIDHVAEDPIFRDHQTPRIYGFQSYIAVPLIRADGKFFGALFALDTAPAKLSNSVAITTLNLFAQLIARELDAGERAPA